jgi:serine/threonine protein kinase
MSGHSSDSIEEVLKTLTSKYEFEISPTFLGEGAQCKIYKGRRHGFECAIRITKRRRDDKLTLSDKSRDEITLELFGTPGIAHPGIISPLPKALQLDEQVILGHVVTLWEFCGGGSLRDRLDNSPEGIAAEELLPLIEDVAKALDHLNELMTYHRDVKPDNILLSHGNAKLADLGMAKYIGGSTGSHSGGGTIPYMPLELLRPRRTNDGVGRGERRHSPTVDVFGLAATYFEMRTGCLPFGDDVGEIIDLQERQYLDLSPLEAWERSAVAAALSKYPQKRPERPGIWAAQLRQAANAAKTGNPRSPSPETLGEMIAKSSELYLSMEQEELRRAEEAEYARKAALEEATRAKRDHMRSVAAGHLQRAEWEQLYDVSSELLRQVPEDVDAAEWLNIAQDKCVPNEIFDQVRSSLRQSQAEIMRSRRLSTRGRFAIAGALLLPVSLGAIVITSWRATASARDLNTADLDYIALPLLAPILAFSLILGGLLLVDIFRHPYVDIRRECAIWVMLGIAWMAGKAIDISYIWWVPLISFGLLFVASLVFLVDRRSESFTTPPNARASRTRRMVAVGKLKDVMKVKLAREQWKRAFKEREQELFEFYRDVWP